MEEATIASRKSNGEATLYQREDKIWVLQISATDERGRTFRKSFTGIRMGELLALTWEDVDFKKKSIRITKDYVRVTTYNQAGEKDGTELIVQDVRNFPHEIF